MLSHYKNKKQKNEAKGCYCTEEDTLVVLEKVDFTVANDVLSFSNEFCVT